MKVMPLVGEIVRIEAFDHYSAGLDDVRKELSRRNAKTEYPIVLIGQVMKITKRYIILGHSFMPYSTFNKAEVHGVLIVAIKKIDRFREVQP